MSDAAAAAAPFWPANDLVARATDGEGAGGAFALLVVAASFVAHFVVLGLQYSCGVVNRALLDDLAISGGDRGSAALIPAVSVACMLLSGVLNGALCERVGARAVARLGCVLVTGGLLASSAAGSLGALFVAYGVVGAGMCFSFAPSLFMVQRHFVRRRAFATGIAVSGSGVGTFVLGPATQLLIERAGWRATLQALAVLAAVALSLVSCAFVPVQPPATAAAAAAATAAAAAAATAVGTGVSTAGAAASAAAASAGTAPLVSDAPSVDSAPLDAAAAAAVVVSTAAAVPAPPVAEAAKAPGTVGSASAAAAAAAAPATPAIPLPKLSLLEVWRSRAFVPLALMATIYGGCLFVCYSHAVLFASDLGLAPERASLVVSYLGGGNMLGRLVFGRLADLPYFAKNRVLLLQVTLGTAGLATAGLAAATSETAVAAWAVSFGALSGSMVSVTPVIVADHLGVENVAHAMGGVYTVQAPTVLLLPPLAGVARGAIGSYAGIWLVTGLLLMLAPLALSLMPRIRR